MKNLNLRALALPLMLALGATVSYAAGLVPPRDLMLVGFLGYMLIDCPPFSNVAATGLTTVKFDNLIGYTVDRIILELGGTALTKAMLTQIRVLANEKEIINDTGTNMDLRNQYRGITANAAYLAIDFEEIRARTIVGQRVGSVTVGDPMAACLRDFLSRVLRARARGTVPVDEDLMRRQVLLEQLLDVWRAQRRV